MKAGNIGYINLNHLNSRISFSPPDKKAFEVWETAKGEIVPVTMDLSATSALPPSKDLQMMGELKEEIAVLNIKKAIEAFGKTAQDMFDSVRRYKTKKDLIDYLKLAS
jgi:hypothetical protein